MNRKMGLLAIGGLLAASVAAGCGSNTSTNSTAKEDQNKQTQGQGQQPQAQQGQAQQQATSPTAAKNKKYKAAPPMTIDPNKSYTATLHTSKGDVKIQLDAKNAPKTVNNFVFLSRDNYYDGIRFHRIIKEFMIQTGDPLGNGTGGPGYKFADELPPKAPYEPGVVAMANSGPNTNGSQFFIGSGEGVKNLQDTPDYTVFGKVVGGMDVVTKIASVPVAQGPTERSPSLPKEEIIINSVSIEEK